MKLCFSPTTIQGDIYALLYHFQQRLEAGTDIDVVVGIDDVEQYKSTPIQQVMPLTVPLWERGNRRFLQKVKSFGPDFFFVDNHLPKKRVFENLVYLWHGFGWKELRAEIEFSKAHKRLSKLLGGVQDANPNFIHQCYGQFERQHRIEASRIHPDNCRVVGMLYADMLLNPPVQRNDIAGFYPFKSIDRPTVMLGFTWGFGPVFQHWDVDEPELMNRLLYYLAEREVNVILRMHDRFRYERSYLQRLEEIAEQYGNVFLKYKDVERDNLFDVLMSDVIVSNFSGLIICAYFTGAASIHLHPCGTQDIEHPLYRKRRMKSVLEKGVTYQWKMPPEENGGLLAATEKELFECLDAALENSACCRQRSAYFVGKYMETSGRLGAPLQQSCCARFEDYLTQWQQNGAKPA